jgi:DNA-binding transcriptional LysR family regulator
MNFIINSLDEFKKKYKNVHIHIILEEINVLSDMEKVGKLDIVIKNNYEDIPNFKHIKTFEINDKFIASSKEFLCLKDKILSINELLNYPTVLLSNITHGRRNFNNYLKSLGIEYKPTYEFNSYSLCKELIKEGFGIGIGNPIHYESSDFLILNTDFNLPTRYFDIGYINTSKNIFIKDFIEIFNNLNK